MNLFLLSFFLMSCQYISPYLPMDEFIRIKKDFEFQKTEYSFKKNWSQKIHPSSKKQKLQKASLLIYKDLVIVADSLFGLKAFKKKDGSLTWSKQIKRGVHSEISLENDVIYFSSKEFFWALHLKNRKVLWKKALFFKLKTKPVFYKNLVCFAGLRQFYCLSKKDGKKAWSYMSPKSSKKFSLDLYRQILKDKDQFFYAFSNGSLKAFKAKNGKLLWSYQFKDLESNLFLSKKTYKKQIFIANYERYILAFDYLKKKPIWKKEYKISAPALIDTAYLYLATKNRLLKIRAKNASVKSSFLKEKSLVKLPLFKHKSFIFLSEFDGSINLYKNRLLASYRTGWGALFTKAHKNKLYVISKAGKLLCLQIPRL